MTLEELKKRPYVKSLRHPHMSLADRSAQFMPFAALTGHDSLIKETSRLTDSKIVLDEYEKMDLNEKLTVILKMNNPAAEITYFEKDIFKAGGRYVTETVTIKKYDEYNKLLVLDDNRKINISDVVSIDHEIFRSLV